MSKKTTTVEVLLTASGKGLVSTFKKASHGVKAFNDTVGNGTKMVGALRDQVVGLAGAYVGLQAIGNVNQMLLDASTAAYALGSSLQAANREFRVGTLEQWNNEIGRLSEKLRIYATADIQNAAARTVDMTKRLGMSTAQMQRIIELTGDLSAGKTTLEGGIERVTAALRGEAEASEYLGLTLNETYVKAWHEAHSEHRKAWKDLTDLEKAQIRYNVFLEQAIPVQGKAAESVTTYGGAVALIKKEIADGIAQNENLVESLKEIAVVLNENSEELAGFASAMASGAALLLEFLAANRELIVSVGKWSLLFGVAYKSINFMLTGVRGLSNALVAMSGLSIVSWLKNMGTGAMAARAGIVALAGTAGGLALTLVALPAAAGFAAVNIAKLVRQYLELRRVQRQIAAQSNANAAAANALAAEYQALSDRTGLVIRNREELSRAVKEGKIHYDDAVGEWVAGAGKMAAATKEQATTVKQVTGAALEEMQKKYREYADQVLRLQDEISGREQSLAEQLRAMARTGMSDLGAWRDRRREAEEYEAAARRAMEAGDYDEAAKLADKARTAYADLNKEVKAGEEIAVSQKEALATAMSGVESAGNLAVEALKKQQDAAQVAMEALTEKSGFQDLSEGMEKAERDWLNNWQTMRALAIKDIDAVEERLLAIKDREVTVWVNEKIKRATGGHVGFRTGGKLPGYGGGDRIQALLEAGEFVIRKEAVSKFGSGIFHALNNLRLPDFPRFADGGPVGVSPGASPTIGHYTHDINFPGGAAPVRVSTDKQNAAALLNELARMGRMAS